MLSINFFQASEWITLFTSLSEFCDGYANGDITPYMHVLSAHVPFLMQKLKNIKQFTCQGMYCRYKCIYTPVYFTVN